MCEWIDEIKTLARLTSETKLSQRTMIYFNKWLEQVSFSFAREG